MKKTGLIVMAVIAIVISACKTTEANYRQAYERAMAARDSVETYGEAAHRMDMRVVVIGNDSVNVKSERVRPTDDGGAPSNILAYNVVVGQFKQRFNAMSLRTRLVDAGYADAFVVETAEPYYYIILSTHSDVAAAARALRAIPTGFPVAMRSPLPFILQTSR
ncbi:MAG: hypothetical protein ACI31C_00175 [Muribaculaceae bacterium]